MTSQGSQIFSTWELLGIEKIHDKLIRIGVAHLTSTMTHYDVFLLLFTILN